MSLASFVGKEDRELPGGFGEGLFFSGQRRDRSTKIGSFRMWCP